MKVFVFCLAVCLATSAIASPIDADDEEIVDDVQPEPEPVVEEPLQRIVPYDYYDAPELTEEQMERTYGIILPLCQQYSNDRIALHLSHPVDCQKFYKCFDGHAYLMDCPADEHWSVQWNRCDYPEFARCHADGSYHYRLPKIKPVQAANESELPAENNDIDPSVVGEFEVDPRCEGSDPFKPLHFNHPTDCSKFYKCYMGKAYVIKCPKGQQWAEKFGRCEHPQIARCRVAKPVAPVAASASDMTFAEEEYDDYYEYYDYGPSIMDEDDYKIKDPRCEPDDEDRFHPVQFLHPRDCTVFYKCWEHWAYKTQCPGGLHFNERDQVCDYPESAKCPLVNIRRASENLQPQAIPTCPHDHDIKFMVEGNPHQFFECVQGSAFLRECVDGENYNPHSGQCEMISMMNQQTFGMGNYPGMMPNYPGGMVDPHYGMGSYPGMMPNYPGMMPNYPGMMPNYPGMMPNYPGMMPNYPGMMPNYPMQSYRDMPPMPNPVPHPVPHQDPQPPRQNQPQVQPPRPNQPQVQPPRPNPEFPSWMPIPNPNMPLPDFTSNSQGDHGDFNYQVGQVNQRCPDRDDPSKPIHLSHESECGKFYKCFSGRAFMMDCPQGEEWSDNLQRCDYHQFADCDPVELLKKKIQM